MLTNHLKASYNLHSKAGTYQVFRNGNHTWRPKYRSIQLFYHFCKFLGTLKTL